MQEVLIIFSHSPVVSRTAPHISFKLPVKIGKIAVAAVCRYIRDIPVGFMQSFAGGPDPELDQMFHSAYPCCFLKTGHKVAFAQVAAAGQLADGHVFPVMPLHIEQGRPDQISLKGFCFRV